MAAIDIRYIHSDELEDEIAEILPPTYYPHWPLKKRIEQMVGDWRRLVQMNRSMEDRLARHLIKHRIYD